MNIFCKKIKLSFNFFIYVLICVAIVTLFFSCDVKWNGNFAEQILSDTQAVIYFYSDREDLVTAGTNIKVLSRKYTIGSNLTQNDLPSSNDFDFAKWSDKQRIGGWKYYRKTGGSIDLKTGEKINSYLVNGESIDLYAIWDTSYTVKYKYQKINGIDYDVKEETLYGESESFTNVVAQEVAGFKTPVYQNEKIMADGSTEIEVFYERKQVLISLDINGGTLVGDTTITGLYGAPVDKDKIGKPVLQGYDFKGWQPVIPDYFPENDITCKAIYSNQGYSIKYYDFDSSGNFTNKTFTGKMSLPDTYEYGSKIYIPNPESSISKDSNQMTFAGWFTDSAGTIPLDSDVNGYYISETNTGDIELYAKWKSKYIYIDSQNGDDSNNGYDSSNALKTVNAAKKYLKHCSENPALKVCSTISSAEDIAALSNLTTTQNNNAILLRDETNKNALINLSSGSTLSVLTIDGNNISCSNELILCQSGSNTLSDVIIKNCKVTGTNTGIIKVESDLTCDGIIIQDCQADYGIFHNQNSNTLSFKGNTKIDDKNKIFLGSNCSIKLTGGLTENFVATIYSQNYVNSPKVLTQDSGNNFVEQNYNKFNLAHAGYSINKDGNIAKASSGGIEIETPEIQVLQIGSLIDTMGIIDDSGTLELTYSLNKNVAKNIKPTVNGDSPYAQTYICFTLTYLSENQNGNSLVGTIPYNSSGYFIVQESDSQIKVDLYSCKSGHETLNLIPGVYSLSVSAQANDSSMCFETETYQIILTY